MGLLTAVAPASLSAQQATDSLRAEVGRLSALVDSLAQEVARLRGAGQEEQAQDALAQLRAAAAAAAGASPSAAAPQESDQPPQFVGRQRSLQALNPEISVNADFMGFVDPNNTHTDNFIPREFEMSFVAALDPFSRAKVFVSRHTPGPEVTPFAVPGEAAPEEPGSFEVEEGYAEWVSLPGGLGLKLGKFQQRFGTMNRWHSHALPFHSRSLPHLAYLGEEALSQAGASVTWLAPFGGGAAGTYELTGEVTRSDVEFFGDSHRPSLLGNLNSFWHLSASTDIELSLSWLNGSYEDDVNLFDRNLYGAEFAFNWIPPLLTRQRGLTVRGGLMVLDGLLPASDPSGIADTNARAKGFWSSAEVRLSPNWLVGGRFDRAENPTAPDVTQTLMSPTITWWQSEFVRIRAEYDLLGAFADNDSAGLFALQVTFAMGPHKHETY